MPGNKVFVIRRQQIDMPIHTAITIFQLFLKMKIVTAVCPSGCYHRFVILFAVPPHSSRQLSCPSPYFIHPLHQSLITPCSQWLYVFGEHWIIISTSSYQHIRMLAWFYSLILRFFISVRFSPLRCPYSYARRSAPACVTGLR